MLKPSDLLLGVTLGLVAGYIDTAGFVALFGLFTAHVTGNFVLIGTELARPSGAHVLLLKFAAIPAFAAGVVFGRLLDYRCARLSHNPARPLLLMQLVLLVGFTAAGVAASPILDAQAPLVLVCGMLGAAGMGVHNAASKLQFGRLAPTTVMTGNVTQILIDLTDMATGRATAAVRERFLKFLWPMLAFAFGCIAGGTAYVVFGFWCMVPALAIIAWLSVLDWPLPVTTPGAAAPA